MEWLTGNWEWLVLGVFVLDKIVAVTPTKHDDLILSAIKGVVKGVTGKEIGKPKIDAGV